MAFNTPSSSTISDRKKTRSGNMSATTRCRRAECATPRLFRQQPSTAEPVCQQRRPFSERRVSQIEPHSVRTFFEEVHFRGDAGLVQREIERHTIFRGN